MTHVFRLNDHELNVLDYAITQTLYRIEASIDSQKFFYPDNTELILALNELLLDLEYVHSELFEGGDS